MTNLISKTESFVLQLFKDKLSNIYVYHNFNHTKRVVESAKYLAEQKNLNKEDELILLLSAWLHDTGYTVSENQHEKESKRIAKEFLEGINVSQDIIRSVEKTIDVTQVGTPPNTEVEKIIKDADCSHFAKDNFKEVSELLRQELSLRGQDYSADEWMNLNIELLSFVLLYRYPDLQIRRKQMCTDSHSILKKLLFLKT